MKARAGIGLFLVATMVATPPSVQAQGKEHSDRSVAVLMEYAWHTIPTTFRDPNGEVITVDRTKKRDVMVPLEKAREIVNIADRSARAQYCGLAEEQIANFHTMMRREASSEQWTRQQMVFIRLLHAITVAYLTGTMKFQFGADGEKDVEIVTKGPVWSEPCTDGVRDKIKARITAYLNEAPATPAAKPSLPAERAVPASGTQVK